MKGFKMQKFAVRVVLTVLSLTGVVTVSRAQVSGSLFVAGDANKFYPVSFSDGGWGQSSASELELGRSSIHSDVNWLGSLMARFQYHTTRWGNGSHFIHADIKQVKNGNAGSDVNFIAGWTDATGNNADFSIVIWLKGGGVSYFYRSKFAVSTKVYDGVANALPFQEQNGPAHSYKTAIDPLVNPDGISHSGSAYFYSPKGNFFEGSVGIGAIDTKGYKLAVAGGVIAESVKVKLQTAWPDFVFLKSHPLPSLAATEKQIAMLGHLPGMPSAAQVKSGGIDLGDMNARMLQKIEELTLHLIRMEKQNQSQRKDINGLKLKMKALDKH